MIIKPIQGSDYPTLPFKVQQSGYSTTNSNDFTFTEYNGAPGRINAAFLNGWKTAQLQILFKDKFEQSYWQQFYELEFNGSSGGLGSGVVPFFANIELGGTFGKFLCQLTKAEWGKSTYRGMTSVLNLTVQVSPDSFESDAACKKEVINSFITCGVRPESVGSTISSITALTNEGMNPINFFYKETAPILKSSPSSSTEAVGIEHELKSAFKGNNLSFTWYENDVEIQGANEEVYTFIPAPQNNGSKYRCEASNTAGTASTFPAELTLRRRIYINTDSWDEFESFDNVKLTFKSNGFIDIETPDSSLVDYDRWIDPVDNPDLGSFDLSQYQARVSMLPDGMTLNHGSIGESFEAISRRSYYEFSGDGAYIEIPDVNLIAGDTISFSYIAPTSASNTTILPRMPTRSLFALNSNGTIYLNPNFTATYDGIPVVEGIRYDQDGKSHDVVITCVSPEDILVSIGTGSMRHLDVSVYDVSIKAAEGNRFYPINDGWDSNPVIIDTESGINGTAVNFNQSGWVGKGFIDIDVSGMQEGQSSSFEIEFNDPAMPNYNWGEFDTGNVKVKRIATPDIPPVVVSSPSSSTESVGLNHTFYAEFSGTNLTYQWYEDGVAISGANADSYSFLPNSSKNGSEYYCIATNSKGSAQTSTATLSLRPRIYFNTSAWPTFDSTGTVKVTLKETGFMDITTSDGTITDYDFWISPVNDPNLPPFNFSEYRARVARLSGPITIEPGSIGETFTTLTNGAYIEINLSGLSDGQNAFFDIEFEDSKLPGYNWAGWEVGNVFVRRVSP